MEIRAFIGKVVIESGSGKRYVLTEITSPYIAVKEENDMNSCRSLVFGTINGDPFSNGTLSFEDKSLAEPFKAAYDVYCRSKDAYWEEYGYWMRKD